jgi:hypothetical protein
MTTIMTYKNELTRLSLQKDPSSLIDALKLKKEWDSRDTDCSVETRGVNKKNMIKMLSGFGDVFGTPIKIEVQKVGFNNLCHNNCINLCEMCPEYEVQLGYNITACNCGNVMCMEIHSVIKDKDEKLYDITPDFNNETEKWFVPLNTNKTIHQIMTMCGRKYEFYNTGMRKCKCGVKWSKNMPTFVPTEFTDTIKNLNRIRIF